MPRALLKTPPNVPRSVVTPLLKSAAWPFENVPYNLAPIINIVCSREVRTGPDVIDYGEVKQFPMIIQKNMRFLITGYARFADNLAFIVYGVSKTLATAESAEIGNRAERPGRDGESAKD